MPTRDSTTTFQAKMARVYEIRGESALPFAKIPVRTVTMTAIKRAERIAAALNDAVEHRWVGDGPTVEEAGGESILVRCKGEELAGVLWPSFWQNDEWQCLGVRVAGSHWIPDGWRRMPAAPRSI